MASKAVEKLKEQQREIKDKKHEDIQALAKRGVYLNEGHAVKPGTLLRIIDIAKEIAKGTPAIEIRCALMDKYDIDERKANQYYDAALAYLTPKDIEHHQEKMAAKLVTQYEQLYQKAVDRDMIKTARDILDSLAKIYQLTGGNRVQIAENQEGDKQITITFG